MLDASPSKTCTGWPLHSTTPASSGGIAPPRRGRPAMCVEQQVETEGLGCLNRSQGPAIRTRDHDTVIVHLLEAVRQRHPGDGRPVQRRSGNRPVDERCCGEWTRRVMYKHQFGRPLGSAGKALKASKNRRLPRRTTMNRGHQALGDPVRKVGNGCLVQRVRVGRDDADETAYGWISECDGGFWRGPIDHRRGDIAWEGRRPPARPAPRQR